MEILEFTCPRCRGKVRAEILKLGPGSAEDSILLTCPESDGKGCGWMGYLPRSRGVVVE